MDTSEKIESSASATAGHASGDHAHIVGWGADLDKKNRPAVPMERTPPRLTNPPLTDPSQQPVTVKVLTSTERPGITPIFGSPNPPSGVSGAMRSLAFKWSENDLRHWLLLRAADRVNMVEGIVEDLSKGVVPNVFAEMGIRSAWKHDRAGVVRKALIATAIVGVAVYQLQKPKRTRTLRRRLRGR